nr:unnamed protein product [Digitaria exilis]
MAMPAGERSHTARATLTGERSPGPCRRGRGVTWGPHRWGDEQRRVLAMRRPRRWGRRAVKGRRGLAGGADAQRDSPA